MQVEPKIDDLVIEECIPSCKRCAGIWINQLIQHKILCSCMKCEHGKKNETLDPKVTQPLHQKMCREPAIRFKKSKG